MDYKINTLKTEVPCNEMMLQDIPLLKFGIVDNRLVFDATAYCESQKIDFNVKTFSRGYRMLINILAQDNNISIGELFYQNKNGHILIDRELVFIFLACTEPNMLIYFNQLINDALTEGIALSDGYIASVINAKVPSNVLENIIQSRNNEKGK